MHVNCRSFQALINREWLLGGHPFTTRLSHIAYATGTQTGPYEAPTFLCFLDCVYQVLFNDFSHLSITFLKLQQHYQLSFEYDDRLLMLLYDHACASEYGTFLGDSDKERFVMGVKEKTTSLWYLD